MKFIKTNLLLIEIILLSFISKLNCADEDELAINFLPSEKYKLNKKDLLNLRTDIERQV